MKKILIYFTFAFIGATSLTGCYERYVTYSDREYVMFADTMAVYPVQEAAPSFKIPVVSTVKKDYDRTFGIEVVDKGSNAIERKHYHLESNTVTIKAGPTRADVLVHGHFDSFEPEDSIGFELQLVMNDELEFPLYGRTTKAVMQKTGPFEISKFTGYCVLSSIFLQEYGGNGGHNRLIFTRPQDPDDPDCKSIVCENWLKDGYNVVMAFDDSDPLRPLVTMEKNQVAADQGSFFGITYGQWGDKLLVGTSDLAESIFYPLGGYLSLWTEISVEEYGVVGHFYNVMEWVTDEEADRIKREGF